MSLHINTIASPLNTARPQDVNPPLLGGVVRRLPPATGIAPASEDAAIVSLSARETSPLAFAYGAFSMATGGASSNISLLQTASRAIDDVKSSLQQIRLLAVDASRATRTPEQREVLQANASQLVADIDRIATRTQFNGIRLFDQNAANVTGDPSAAAILKGLKGGWLENAEKMIQTFYGLKADGAPLNVELTSFTDGPYGVAARVLATAPAWDSGKGSNLRLQLDRADFLPATSPNGGSAPLYSDRIIAHEMTHAVLARTTNYANLARNALWFVEGIAEFIHGGDERFAYDLQQNGGNIQTIVNALNDGILSTSADYSASYAAVRYLHDQIKTAGGEGIKDVMDYLGSHQSATLNDAFRNSIAPLGAPVSAYTSAAAFLQDFRAEGAAFIAAHLDLTNADTGAIGGFDADRGTVRTAASVVPDGGTRSGSNGLAGFAERFETVASERSSSAGTARKAIVGAMSAAALGVSALNLIDDPLDAIGQADRALRYVSSEQTRVASQLNGYDTMFARLQNVFSGLGGNLAWLGNPGLAAGLGALLGNSIQSDADSALRAQANVDRQMVLQLLRVT
ncbi:MAG TPA: flagellinolysin [Noviherbaspirillum sp.]